MRRTIVSVLLLALALSLVGIITMEARDSLRKRAQQLANEKWQREFNSAKALNDQRRYIAAEGALTAMLPETEKTFPGQSQTFDTLDLLGRVEVSQEAFADAEPVLLRALALARTLPATGNNKMAVALEDLGMLYQNWGRTAQQESYLREAIGIFERDPGQYAGDLAVTSDTLSMIEYDKGHYEAAVSLLEKAIEKYPVYPGPHRAYMVGAYLKLAQTEGNLRRFSDAEQNAQLGLAMARQYMTPDEPAMLDTLNRAGYVYIQESKYVLAEPLLKGAYEAAASPTNAGDIEIRRIVAGNLAEVFTNTGRNDAAETLYKQELADATRVLGPEASQTTTAIADLGVFYRDNTEKYPQAEALLKQALANREKLFGPDDPQTAGTRSDLALAYFYQRKPELGEESAARALPVLEKAFGAVSLPVSTALNRLGLCQRDQGKYPLAIPTLQRALAIRKSILPPGHYWIAVSTQALASAYRAARLPQPQDDPSLTSKPKPIAFN